MIAIRTSGAAGIWKPTFGRPEIPSKNDLKALKIFDVNWEVADRSAQLVREYKSKGRILGVADALIAGTCLLHNLTLVTYNVIGRGDRAKKDILKGVQYAIGPRRKKEVNLAGLSGLA